jgi:uncharacterized protein
MNHPAEYAPEFVDRLFPAEHELAAFFDQPSYIDLIREIVQSDAFQRLSDIRFLGAIDYLTFPNGSSRNKRHTRFHHSLCVGRLARQYSQKCALSDHDEKHVVVAGLLHDVGHGPLSHSLEPVFKERFRLTHHEATGLIIKGSVPVGHALPGIFRRHGLNADEITDLISGTSHSAHAELFSSPVNIDTIEAILRAYTYISPAVTILRPRRVLQAVIDRGSSDTEILDSFWNLKNIVYRDLITSRLGVLADYICREYMRSNAAKFWSGNYFITETALRKGHPLLFSLLKELRATHQVPIQTRIEYQQRTFFIDPSVQLSDFGSLHGRYRQDKRVAFLSPSDLSSGASGHALSDNYTELDLFSSGRSEDAR